MAAVSVAVMLLLPLELPPAEGVAPDADAEPDATDDGLCVADAVAVADAGGVSVRPADAVGV